MDLSAFLIQSGLVVGVMALSFGFSNGFRDSSTIVATVVSTRALSPSRAYFFAAIFEFIGAFFVGSQLIATIGRKLFVTHPGLPQIEIFTVLGSALTAAFIWGIVSWWRAWPTSNNQALISALVGASLGAWGWGGISSGTLFRVVLVLLSSPLIGFVGSYGVASLIRFLGQWCTPQVSGLVKVGQIASCFMVSVAHGSNDGQLILGVLTLGFGVLGYPLSVSTGTRALVALCLAGGVVLGGQRILRRMGMKFYHIRLPQGLTAQFTSAITILSCAINGFPASTMQVMTGSIIGSGAAYNPKAIRWQTAKEIVLSWFLTIPAALIMGFVLCHLYQELGRRLLI